MSHNNNRKCISQVRHIPRQPQPPTNAQEHCITFIISVRNVPYIESGVVVYSPESAASAFIDKTQTPSGAGQAYKVYMLCCVLLYFYYIIYIHIRLYAQAETRLFGRLLPANGDGARAARRISTLDFIYIHLCCRRRSDQNTCERRKRTAYTSRAQWISFNVKQRMATQPAQNNVTQIISQLPCHSRFTFTRAISPQHIFALFIRTRKKIYAENLVRENSRIYILFVLS